MKASIEYKITPDGPLALDLYYPAVKISTKHPLVVYAHGGGWTVGSKAGATKGNMGRVVKGLNERGFCVASIDYRLCSEGGKIRIKDCVTDSKDAVRYLVKNSERLSLDPNKVFTFGDSAGGQIAQMLLLTEPETFPGDPLLAGSSYKMIAGVSWYGPCDFEKTELFNPDGQPGFKDRFESRILESGSDPEEKLAAYREMSPVNYLKASSPPLLMIQGDKDTTIPVSHARYMQERANAVRAPVEILIVNHAGHNWRKVDADIQPSQDKIVEKTVMFLTNQLDFVSK